MPRKPEESNAMWCERAIVANSLAADELEAMTSSPVQYNAHAEAAVYKLVAAAQDDLKAALDAYTYERWISTNILRGA